MSRLRPGGSTVWHKQERDRDGMQSMSRAQTLQQAAQAAASTWGPLMPSPQLFVLLQPLASAHTGAEEARVRTRSQHPHLEAPEGPAAAPTPLPFPSIEGHLPSPQHLTPPMLSSKAVAMPTSPLRFHMPAQSHLAGFTEMSASSALSASAFWLHGCEY